MQWRDLLYFSSGERRALTLLIVLLLIATSLLVYADYNQSRMVSGLNGNSIDSQNTPAKSSSHPSNGKGKYPTGTVIELNTADTTELKKIPGIGSVFANRIVKYRNLLGGFYTVDQLSEVYGIDEERFMSLRGWFFVDPFHITKLNLNEIGENQFKKHPYVNYRQARTLARLIVEKGPFAHWQAVPFPDEFAEQDKQRLKHYFDFKIEEDAPVAPSSIGR